MAKEKMWPPKAQNTGTSAINKTAPAPTTTIDTEPMPNFPHSMGGIQALMPQSLYQCFDDFMMPHIASQASASGRYDELSAKYFASNDDNKCSDSYDRDDFKVLGKMKGLSIVAQFEALQAEANYNGCMTVYCKLPMGEMQLESCVQLQCNITAYIDGQSALSSADATIMAGCIDNMTTTLTQPFPF